MRQGERWGPQAPGGPPCPHQPAACQISELFLFLPFGSLYPWPALLITSPSLPASSLAHSGQPSILQLELLRSALNMPC